MPGSGGISKKWILLFVPLACFLFLLAFTGYVYFWPKRVEDRIRAAVTRALADRFQSDVELQDLKLRVFASPNVTGEGLVLRYHGRKDVPPLIQVEKFSFTAGIRNLMGPVKHISLVLVQNMVISIPPRGNKPESSASKPAAPSQRPGPDGTTPEIIVDRVVCSNLDIRILPKQEGKEPLDWENRRRRG